MGSTRLPDKVLRKIYNGKHTLDIQISKLQKAFPYIPIFILTSSNKKDDLIQEYAEQKKINFFRGDEENVLKRFIDAAEFFDIDSIIRVCGDNPFLDMGLIRDLLKYMDYDYVSYKRSDNTPAIRTHLGIFVEILSKNSLKRILNLTNEHLYLEHVTNYIYSNPDLFRIKWINMPKYLDELRSTRLTLDTKCDFQNIQSILQNIGDESEIIKVLDFIERSTDLKSKMKAQIIENEK